MFRSQPEGPTTVIDRMTAFSSLASLLGLAMGMASLAVVAAEPSAKQPASVLDFHAKDINGTDVPLSKYQGKVLLIVNTASQCGLTPQYKGLEAAFEKYKDQGFEVLGFPANEFGKQEPGTNEEIKRFCNTKYSVTFPMFSKIVVKGEGIHPLYDYLTSEKSNPKFAGAIDWNFAKFLVNRKGEVVARFAPKVTPDSPEVTSAIEKALAAK
jgi:glutathione peroxidase